MLLDMAKLGRYLSLGIVSALFYCASEVIPLQVETEAIRSRWKPYKKTLDLNSDGKKDYVFEDGSIFLQTSEGRYERVTPSSRKGQPGYVTRRNIFYDLKGQAFDLNAPKKKTPRRDETERDTQTMLTSILRNDPWA
jgi:hypothetical protein